jgi:hypothetical protein
MYEVSKDEFPLLSLANPPEVIADMLDDIHAELGTEVIMFLRQAKCLGKVVAVLLECKAADRTPNLLEACALANVEREVCDLIRAADPMEFSTEDLDTIIVHAKPAMMPLEAAAVRRERRND